MQISLYILLLTRSSIPSKNRFSLVTLTCRIVSKFHTIIVFWKSFFMHTKKKILMYEINFKFQSLAGGLAHFSNEHMIVLMGFLRGAGGGGGAGVNPHDRTNSSPYEQSLRHWFYFIRHLRRTLVLMWGIAHHGKILFSFFQQFFASINIIFVYYYYHFLGGRGGLALG